MSESHSSIPVGECQCGCGQRTTVAHKTNSAFGYVKGVPMRYVNGHGSRKYREGYIEEDRGYKTHCWIWQGCTDSGGYGRIWRDGVGRPAHRFYYEQVHGPVTTEHMDHLCRVRPCVNPEHLEPVTCAVNAQRGVNAKLTQTKADQMRRLYEVEGVGRLELMKLFRVGKTTTHRVLSYQSWLG